MFLLLLVAVLGGVMGPVSAGAADRTVTADIEGAPGGEGEDSVLLSQFSYGPPGGAVLGAEPMSVVFEPWREVLPASATVTLDVVDGPSQGVQIVCTGDGTCTGDGIGLRSLGGSPSLRFEYEALVSASHGTDQIEIFLDLNGNGELEHGEWPEPGDERHYETRTWWEPLDVVFLGDSYTAGDGLGEYFTQPLDGKDRCSRSTVAYPNFVVSPSSTYGSSFKSLDDTPSGGSWGFFACTGAITANVFDTPFSRPDMISLLPFQQSWDDVDRPLQVDRIDDKVPAAEVDLVVLTIGGNDALFAKILTHCATINAAQVAAQFTLALPSCAQSIEAFYPGSDSWATPGDEDDVWEYAQAWLPQVQARVEHTIAEIHDVAPQARVLLVGYPKLVAEEFQFDADECANSTKLLVAPEKLILGSDPSGPSTADKLNGLSADLNGALSAAAYDAGADFANPTTFWSHGLCAEVQVYDPDSGPWLYGLDRHAFFGGDGDGPVHPNEQGHRKGYARTVQDWMSYQWDEWEPNGLAPRVPPAPPTEDPSPTPDPGPGPLRQQATQASDSSSLTPTGPRGAMGAVALGNDADGSTDVRDRAISLGGADGCGQVERGSTVPLTAAGFQPSSTARLYSSGAADVQQLTVAADGSVSGQLKVTGEAELVLLVQGKEPGGQQHRTLAFLSVVAPGTPCDREDPVVQIISPAQGQQVPYGTAVQIGFICSDNSTVFDPDATVVCGGDLDPGETLVADVPGEQSFTVYARDKAGNERTETITYTVVAPQAP